ncbi:MAG: hypothetical protein NTV05_02100 [Acidobacteria bacterium]|nr:hypothetical protein [Acidobacteriota bacterium]
MAEHTPSDDPKESPVPASRDTPLRAPAVLILAGYMLLRRKGAKPSVGRGLVAVQRGDLLRPGLRRVALQDIGLAQLAFQLA